MENAVAWIDDTRHYLPADLAAALRAARLRRVGGLRRCAGQVGISPGYLCMLEQGKRCPSVAVARDLAAVLKLEQREPDLAARLLALARPDAGRSWTPPQ